MPKHLASAIPAEELLEATFLKVMLLGPSGSGKTTGACTFPGRKLLIDLDNRAHSIAGTPDVEVIPCYETSSTPRALQKFESIRKELQLLARKDPEAFPYSTIILDGLTALNRITMNWALLLDPKRGLGGAPAMQHYLPQMNTLAKEILAYIALPAHVVLTGHPEIIENELDGTTKVLPKTTGKLRTEIANWFSECYKCYRTSVKGKVHYFWDTIGTGVDDFYKSSLNKAESLWKSPLRVNLAEQPCGFAKLLELASQASLKGDKQDAKGN